AAVVAVHAKDVCADAARATVRRLAHCGTAATVHTLAIEAGRCRRTREGQAQGAADDPMGGAHGSGTPQAAGEEPDRRRNRASLPVHAAGVLAAVQRAAG